MAESPPTVSLPPHPNHMVPPIPSADPPHPLLRSLQSPPPPTPPPPPPPPTSGPIFFKRPSVRVTSEFDSDSSLFLHKVSCKLFDSLAKLKVSFRNNNKGEVSEPQIAFTSKLLSIHYDLADQNALIKGSFDVGPTLQFKAAHDVKAKEGEVSMVAKLADPGYALELSTPVPTIGLPRATFKFPLGEVSLEEREDEEVKRSLSVGGIVKGQMLNGLCTAQFNDEDLKLRYAYKVVSSLHDTHSTGTTLIPTPGVLCTSTHMVRITNLKPVMIQRCALVGHRFGLEMKVGRQRLPQ
ncbi:outer envelope pore protein 37, chloroplastic isoform X3 [Hevea brasiliensis]|uniref:outer envelope pore protein 37, chloroplastic isoform X3 n=1 Tax=Hevea brasiliensis TaxID=3981 RepID=UPI0025DF7CCD|nr:outer envelope pore protein 37, chloroplastic isoform X3 [Hevea brasiliensis]